MNTSKNKNEKKEESPNTAQIRNKSLKPLNEEEVKAKVLERKGELEHQLYDVITKNEVSEKKTLDELKKIDKEDEKKKKMEMLNEEKNKNEQKVSQMKEYNLYLISRNIKKELFEYEKKLKKDNNIT